MFTLHPRQALHPLYVRSDSSDLAVFAQIFIDVEYACLSALTDVGLIIDCGANVGYSSAYFLSSYPDCHAIAVEPDPGNFAMLQRNLAPYGSRATTIHAGIWSHRARLAIVDSPYRDGREWARQVRECAADEEAAIDGVDIAYLIENSGRDRVSILKMDVEGAEAVVFASNYESWLGSADAIVIELHDDSAFGNASEVFFSAIEGRDFQISRSGELTVCMSTRVTEPRPRRGFPLSRE